MFQGEIFARNNWKHKKNYVLHRKQHKDKKDFLIQIFTEASFFKLSHIRPVPAVKVREDIRCLLFHQLHKVG